MRDFLGKHDIRLVNNYPALIGLTGAAGAGKTEVGKWLDKCAGYDRMAFSTPIKIMLQRIGVPYENLYGSLDEKNKPLNMLGGRSARYAMQTLGTEWGRDTMCSDLWVGIWRHNYIKAARRDGCLHRFIVVDDVRFPEEVAILRGLGGLIVEVEGPNRRVHAHRSERPLTHETDFVWHNERREASQLSFEFDRLMQRLCSRPVEGNWWSLERSNAYKRETTVKARVKEAVKEWKV